MGWLLRGPWPLAPYCSFCASSALPTVFASVALGPARVLAVPFGIQLAVALTTSKQPRRKHDPGHPGAGSRCNWLCGAAECGASWEQRAAL
jgi:hypothetical protein